MNRCSARFCVLLLLICPVIALAQKIKVDYDRGIDFSAYKTYAWAELGPVRMPLLRLDIVGTIDEQLAAKGLVKTDKGGDLIVGYSGDMFGESNVGASTPGYPGLAGQPPSVSDTMWTGQAGSGGGGMIVTYPKGTLVVEFVDPRAGTLVWRAAGALKLDIEKKQESLARINKMLVSMLGQYPPSKK